MGDQNEEAGKMIVLIPKYGGKLGEGFSKVEKLKAAEHPGRNTRISGYQSPSNWVDQLVSLRRGVLLCTWCRHKFDPKKHRYRRGYFPNADNADPFKANGRCEDCKKDTRTIPGGGTFFVPEEIYNLAFFEPATLRQRARHRAMMAAHSTWNAIQRTFRR